ncbi:proline dehydrogenase family protein [Edaphobacter sp.]|uniref:proline dehydrogenase family protein n=1 Tax=Edaphobacter sp. TaxID=1934404 RepID=UPI002DBB2991|nr:proline dehydrogenase family protein [Edaphobacter sp.]HEU5342360.1 proline dehydrogenase family protein [Edaphobacter sp.]
MLRSAFIALSQNKRLRAFSERSSAGRQLSSRFVAGMTIEDAAHASERVNHEGIAVTLDSLGESVTTAAEAQASAAVYHQLLDLIQQRGLNANVSVKLSQVGMDFDPALAERIVGEMVEHAARTGSFVRIDMEGSPYTEATIAITERLAARFPGAVGTVLQAYLYRTEADAERLLGQGIRIRLCKGAYKEGPEVAFAAKADVDANYIKLMKRMVTFTANGKGVFCGIATHDETIVEAMRTFVRDNNVPKSAFEFQMLYGIRRDLQRRLADEGFGVRVYVPFGPEWYPYFMRRLAERPANVFFLLKNFFRN